MSKTTMLKVGDRVRISKDSQFYRPGVSESNPSDVTGTIEKVNECEMPEFCYSVKWDNGRDNSYREGDLYLYSEKKNNDKADKLTVSKEFVLEAHKAACADWKQRLEEEFPKVFETDKYPTLVDLKDGETLVSSTLYAQIRGAGYDRYVALRGIQIADGIADGVTLPPQAKHKALYIEAGLLGYGKYEIKHKRTEGVVGESHVVYFEKKK
jgi:hypothetical protein